MRHILTISLALLFIVISGCGTTNLPPTDITDEEVEQANTIILFVEGSQEEAYRGIAQHLMDKGFAFSNTDNTLLSLSTEPNDLGYLSHSISINVSVRKLEKTAIFIRGNVHSNFLGTTRISNVGSSSSIYRASWEDLKEVAEEYTHNEFKFKRD